MLIAALLKVLPNLLFLHPGKGRRKWWKYFYFFDVTHLKSRWGQEMEWGYNNNSLCSIEIVWEKASFKTEGNHCNHGKRTWKCIIPLVPICTGIYILDVVTEIIDKYQFFVVIEVRVCNVGSFHNVTCDFVCFKLNVVLWYFIRIKF